MNKVATFDPAEPLMINFRINRNGSVDFVFKDSNGSDYDISGIDFEFFVKESADNVSKIISLTENNGITISGSTLTVTVSSTQTNLCRGKKYWELYLVNLKKTWLYGNANFYYDRP